MYPNVPPRPPAMPAQPPAANIPAPAPTTKPVVPDKQYFELPAGLMVPVVKVSISVTPSVTVE